MRDEFLKSPVDRPLHAGPPATSGPLGTGGSTAANVNTDTESIAGPHNETSIAVDPTDPKHLIGSANDYQLIVNDDGSISETVYSRAHVSFDRGQTWTNYAIPFPAQYDGTGDPAVAFDADGRAYIATLGFSFETLLPWDVVVSHSTDGGKSWTTPSVVFQGTSDSSGTVVPDKEYIAAWGHGNAIVTYTSFNLDADGNYISSPILATVTHDGGNSWSTPVQISGPDLYDQVSVPVVAKDGSIYVSFLNGNISDAPYRDQYSVVKVDPGTGQALTAPVNTGLVYDGVGDYPINADGRQTYQDSQFRTWAAGNITADPTRAGHLAVVWSDMRNNPVVGGPSADQLDPYQVKTNSDVIVTQSFDGGQTWTSPSAIQRPNDQFMPWAAYDATGRLQIGFFDRSYDSANHQYGYTLASEKSKGQLDFTFQQVSTTLSDPTQGDRWFRTTQNDAFPNATLFLGDYSGIAVVPGAQVASLWTDMRNSATFLGATGSSQDAYFALVKAVPANAPQAATSSTAGMAAGSLASATVINSVANSNPILSSGAALGGAIGNSVVNGDKTDDSVLGERAGIYSRSSALTLLASNEKGEKPTTDFDDIFDVL
jgi:hypothetical protein